MCVLIVKHHVSYNAEKNEIIPMEIERVGEGSERIIKKKKLFIFKIKIN